MNTEESAEQKATAEVSSAWLLVGWFVAVNVIYYIVFALKFAPLRRLFNLS